MSTSTKKDQAQQHAESARESAGQGADKLRDAAGHAADAARTGASAVADTARGAASSAMDTARSAASSAVDTVKGAAGTAASTVGHKAEQATSAVGGGMHSLADTIRDRGPSAGMLGSATGAVAGALDTTGRYLEQENLSGMLDDVTGMIKRNPIPALLLGIGLGFLLGRTLRS